MGLEGDLRRCYYLGPAGTFTEIAARRLYGQTAELVPSQDIGTVIANVEQEASSVGVVPIENSVHGEVTATLDRLAFGSDRVSVVAETSVPVTFVAYATPEGSRAMDFVAAMSHPHALAQCSRYIAAHGLTRQESSSTAAACRFVAEEQRHDLVALAAPGAGQEFGLVPIAEQIEDFEGAATRFLGIGHELPPAAQHNRTMLLVVPQDNRPGALLEILKAFGDRDINMSSLHARPLRSELGTYCFLFVVDLHLSKIALRSALHDLVAGGNALKILGSFPVSNSERPQVLYQAIPGLITKTSELASKIAHPEAI
jgi:prephenate dehydratase